MDVAFARHDIRDPRHRPDAEPLVAAARFTAALDQHHSELGIVLVEQAPEHDQVALLEDPQRQGRVREEHRSEREHRDVRHLSSQPAFPPLRPGNAAEIPCIGKSRLIR